MLHLRTIEDHPGNLRDFHSIFNPKLHKYIMNIEYYIEKNNPSNPNIFAKITA